MARPKAAPATTTASVLQYFRVRDLELVQLAFDQAKVILAQRQSKPATSEPAAPVALAAVEPPAARKNAHKPKAKAGKRKLSKAEHAQRVREGLARRKAALAAQQAGPELPLGEMPVEGEQPIYAEDARDEYDAPVEYEDEPVGATSGPTPSGRR